MAKVKFYVFRSPEVQQKFRHTCLVKTPNHEPPDLYLVDDVDIECSGCGKRQNIAPYRSWSEQPDRWDAKNKERLRADVS